MEPLKRPKTPMASSQALNGSHDPEKHRRLRQSQFLSHHTDYIDTMVHFGGPCPPLHLLWDFRVNQGKENLNEDVD